MTAKKRSRAPASVEGRALTGATAVKNAGFVAVAECVGKVSTLAWTVVAAQQLGQAGFGVFNFALAVGLILAAIGQWGFDTVLVRRASQDVSQLSRFFTEAIVWQVALAAPLLLAGGVVVAFIDADPGASVATAMVLAAVLCDMISDNARAAASTIHRQGITSAALIGQRILMFATAVPLVLRWGDVLTLSAAFLFSSIVGLALHAAALRRLGIRFRVSHISKSGLRDCLRGTGSIGLSSMIGVLQARIGFIILGALAGQQAVGSYSAAFRLYETVLFLSFALMAAVFPLMSVAVSGRALRRLVESSVNILCGFYLPFAVVCFIDARGMIQLVFGQEYVQDASQALWWLAPAPLLFAIAYVGRTGLVAASSTKPLLVATVASTATVAILCLLLVPGLQATGATIALTSGIAVDAVLTMVFLRAALDRWPRLLSQSIQPILCSGIVAVVFLVLRSSFLIELLISAFLYIAAWGSLLWWGRSSASQLVRTLPSRGSGPDTSESDTPESLASEPRTPESLTSEPHTSESPHTERETRGSEGTT
ncbi:flippase [Brevibacterium casei]|uniref:flippase n=1 Tax=Brevibacterium casei TaxID=33889 RepID=UPI00191A3D0C|nr:flippase [Brevibacterium casei]QQT70250.1 flippase [Brevibacterium casei]